MSQNPFQVAAEEERDAARHVGPSHTSTWDEIDVSDIRDWVRRLTGAKRASAMGGSDPKKSDGEKKGKGKSKLGGWKTVELDPELVQTQALEGFSGLEIWTGPVFTATKKVELESVGDDVKTGVDVKSRSQTTKHKSKKDRKGAESDQGEVMTGKGHGDDPAAGSVEGGTTAPDETSKKSKRKRKRKRKPRTKEADDKKDGDSKTKRLKGNPQGGDAAGCTPHDQATDEEIFDTSAWDDLELHPLIMQALAALKFAHPMPIQSRSIPAAVRDRKDILGAAQTGSGKTLAFGLPIIQMILDKRDRPKKKRQPAADDLQLTAFDGVDVTIASGNSMGLDEIDKSLEMEELSEEESEEQLDAHPQQNTPTAASGGDDMDIDLDVDEAEVDVQGSESDLENGINDDEIAALNKALGINPDDPMAAELELGDDNENCLKALILAPTRELALQVCKHLEAFGKICGVRFVTLVGGMSIQKQERILKGCPEVIVATPGRLWDLIESRHPHVSDLSGLQVLVIDEADKMVKQGNFVELSRIMSVVPEYRIVETFEAAQPTGKSGKRSKGKRSGKKDKAARPEFVVPEGDRKMQTFVFSATLTLPESMHKRLKRGGGGAADGESMENVMEKIRFQKNPEIIDLTGKRGVADGVEEACLPCSEDRREVFLYCLLARYPGRTVVFVNAISSVKRLTAILRLLGIDAQPIHAAKQQKQRLKAIDRFTNDPNGVLIATDVAARGLDIKDVRCVVHYQVAASADIYIHRCGRTARVDKEGIAISLVVPKEAARFAALFDKLSRPMPVEFPLDANDLFESKKRLDLAMEIDEINRKLDKAKPKDSWLLGVADDIGLDVDPSMLESSKGLPPAEKDELYAKRSNLVGELRHELAQPLSQKLNSKFFATSSKSVEAASKAVQGKKALKQRFEEKAIKLKERQARLQTEKSKKRKAAAAGERDAVKDLDSSPKRTEAQRLDAANKSHMEMLQARKELSKKKADLMIEQMVTRRAEGKKKGKKWRRALGSEYNGKIYVLPAALGREASGPDALTSLRRVAK